MKRFSVLLFCIIAVCVSATGQRTESILADWQFRLGESHVWQSVRVPHDWAIHMPFDRKNDLQQMQNIQNGEQTVNLKTGRTGGLPYMGTGYYRTNVNIPDTVNASYRLYFDGVMNRSRVYVNGRELKFNPDGYSAFTVDLEEHVREGDNTIEVRIDNPEHSSRWYPGAGIFRPVTLVKTGRVSIPQWGVSITTPVVGKSSAVVSVDVDIVGSGSDSLRLVSEIADRNGNIIAQKSTPLLGAAKLRQNLEIKNPQLWSPETPVLYQLHNKIMCGNQILDQSIEKFGVRKIEFIPERGFSLNGESTDIKGVCIHHDLGALGAAVSEDAIRYRLSLLKDMGCNAIRTSHNLPSTMLVGLCDEIGLMLMIEPFDEWNTAKSANGFHSFFDEYADEVVRNMVRHFRNNPSVVLWGIGNEVPNQRDAEGYKLVQRLQDIVHREDPTRPVTVCMDQIPYVLNNGFGNGVDIPGINYNTWNYNWARNTWGQGMILGSETASCVSSRGVYKFPLQLRAMAMYQDHQSSSYDTEYCSWSNVPDVDFALNDDNSWYLGQFVWTGFDYLGEPTPYNNDSWPSHSSVFGIIDLANLPKDRFFLYRSVWNKSRHTLHILPHWSWKGREGEVTPVMVYTDYPQAELFVNGKSQGVQRKWTKAEVENAAQQGDTLSSLRRYRLVWENVVYEPGTIEVKAYNEDGTLAETKSISSAGKPHKLKLSTLYEGRDMILYCVEAIDKQGNFCPTATNQVTVKVSGGGEQVGIANGDPTCLTPLNADTMQLFSGKLTFWVRRTSEQAIKIKVKGL